MSKTWLWYSVNNAAPFYYPTRVVYNQSPVLCARGGGRWWYTTWTCVIISISAYPACTYRGLVRYYCYYYTRVYTVHSASKCIPLRYVPKGMMRSSMGYRSRDQRESCRQRGPPPSRISRVIAAGLTSYVLYDTRTDIYFPIKTPLRTDRRKTMRIYFITTRLCVTAKNKKMLQCVRYCAV